MVFPLRLHISPSIIDFSIVIMDLSIYLIIHSTYGLLPYQIIFAWPRDLPVPFSLSELDLSHFWPLQIPPLSIAELYRAYFFNLTLI